MTHILKFKKYTTIALLFCISFLNAQVIVEYSIKNLDINTKYSDFGTTFYGEDHIIFSSPKTDKSLKKIVWKQNKQPYLDLFIGSIDGQSELVFKQKLLGEINSKYHQSNVEFTSDLSTIYFTGNDPKNTIYCQLFKATVAADGEWVNVEKLPFNDNKFSTGHPALSPDNKQLYFTSDRPSSIGGADIFVVDINEDGTYSKPRNLGPEVNTKGKDMFPFVSDDGVLYFSSDGHKGNGGLDIFASKITDTSFATPVSLGNSINSKKDDFSFIINSKNNKGYFSSNRKGGKGDDDIYSVEAINPRPLAGDDTILVKNNTEITTNKK